MAIQDSDLYIDVRRDGVDGYYCPRHRVWFSRLETCQPCEADPVPIEPPEAEYVLEGALPPPAGCANSLDHEVWFTKTGDDIKAEAQKLCRGKGRINYATAARLFETAIKARRAAAELALRREDESIVTKRERRMRNMSPRGHRDRSVERMQERADDLRARKEN